MAVLATAGLYGDWNDEFLDAMRAHRRFRATAAVTTGTDRLTMERLTATGFTGMRLHRRKVTDPPDLAAPEWRRLLRRAADLGWHVHLTEDAARMDATIRAVEAAGARVVVDHLGMIDTDLGADDPGFRAILDAVDRGRTWVKLSGRFRFADPARADAAARALVEAAGWERLLWASDWPFVGHGGGVTYADTLADLARWVPDPAMRHAIGAHTPARLYLG
jgi:predicted TIM-barrel fold metal-dependent hydrolase